MAVYKDKILIVDLEATCWEGYDAPAGQENEIIEIGICTLTVAGLALDEKCSLLIQPQQSVISPFCTQLTGITPQMVAEGGMSFAVACARLEQAYHSRNRLWASWGAFDRRLFFDQCKRRQIRYPLHDKHINLKRVFADFYGERMGMARALEHNGLPLEGSHHRGDDDAWNTARLLQKMMQQQPHLLRKYGL
ncbi:MAG: exonuclease domain-containing protein [Anaerolineae bacterium]|nr:exonuclease domain-containing protein [Anaerolineae bacterium]